MSTNIGLKIPPQGCRTFLFLIRLAFSPFYDKKPIPAVACRPKVCFRPVDVVTECPYYMLLEQGYTRKKWIAYKAKDGRSAFMNFMKQI